MSWSPTQQALLGAMGYTLYRTGGQGPSAGAGQAADWPDGPLLRALRRAAGDRDLAGLALPPWERLRADPALKRALWPRLRAFRRAR